MAQHTLNDEEYASLINGRADAQKRAAELEAEIKRVRLEDPANRIEPLNELARHAFTIIRFAVANLNPENTRGWPTEAVHAVADLIPTIADRTTDDHDFANELHAFARDCEQYALHRQQKRDAKLKADAEAPKGDLAEPAQ